VIRVESHSRNPTTSSCIRLFIQVRNLSAVGRVGSRSGVQIPSVYTKGYTQARHILCVQHAERRWCIRANWKYTKERTPLPNLSFIQCVKCQPPAKLQHTTTFNLMSIL